MAHELLKLTSTLYNTPHLVTPDVLENILGYLEKRNATNPSLSITPSANQGYRQLSYNEDTKVGIIPVDGPLTYVAYSGICGEDGCSYQSIQESFDELAEAGAKVIVLDCDGPGGQAYGCFETGQYLRSQADELGIQLISYVDGNAYSATYGIASSAHTIITNPGSQLGSIGVVVQLRNVNAAMQSMGIKDTYITAGENKIPYDDTGEFTKSFIDDLQMKVDSLYKDFISYVSEMRGIDESVVRDTKANTFLAKDAVSLGLADSEMTREEFFGFLADLVENNGNSPMLTKNIFRPKAALETNREKEEMEKLEQLQSEFEKIQASFTTQTATLAELTTALAAKDAELATLKAALDLANVNKEAAEKAQAEAKQTSRKAELAVIVGDTKAAELSVSLKDLPDETFSSILSTFKASTVTELKNPLFKEQGAGGDGDKPVVDGTRLLIDQEYKNK